MCSAPALHLCHCEAQGIRVALGRADELCEPYATGRGGSPVRVRPRRRAQAQLSASSLASAAGEASDLYRQQGQEHHEPP